jgi:hypothetical protein
MTTSVVVTNPGSHGRVRVGVMYREPRGDGGAALTAERRAIILGPGGSTEVLHLYRNQVLSVTEDESPE